MYKVSLLPDMWSNIVFQGTSVGALTGMAVCLWWGVGAMVSGKRPSTLPLKIDGCVAENNTWINITETTATYMTASMTSDTNTGSTPTISDYTMSQSSEKDYRYIQYIL